MKISAFSKKYNIPKTTIRYYTDNCLLLPELNGGCYDYNEQCERDILDILAFKDMGFTIDEIMDYKSKERFHIGFESSDKLYLQGWLDTKITEHRALIESTELRIKQIKRYKKDIALLADPNKSGVPINSLGCLVCDKCSSVFSIKEAHIHNNYILDGSLICECDNAYTISDGVIQQSNWSDLYAANKLGRESYEVNYLSNKIHGVLKKCGREIHPTFESWDHSQGVLFLNADIEIILMELHNSFNKNGLYIFAAYDKWPLLYLKEKLTQMNIPGQFIYVLYVDKLPIKLNIPYIVDMAGDINDRLYNYPGFGINAIRTYIASSTDIIYVSLKSPVCVSEYMDTYRYIGKELHRSILIDRIDNSDNTFLPHLGLNQVSLHINYLKNILSESK